MKKDALHPKRLNLSAKCFNLAILYKLDQPNFFLTEAWLKFHVKMNTAVQAGASKVLFQSIYQLHQNSLIMPS